MPSPALPGSAGGGSEGIDGGSGAVAGSGGLLVEEPGPPIRRFIHLLIMRAMLLGAEVDG
jgi:hypothetical protein